MGGEKIVAGLIAAAGAHWVLGCSRERLITVGSKNFTEQVILGEIVAQHVSLRLSERVDRKLNLGGTLLAHQALVKGDLDLYPEYTGTALTAVLKRRLSSDPAAVLAKVKAEYLSRFKILWLDPLGFNNTFAMVIRGEDARKFQIETLSDAATQLSGGREAPAGERSRDDVSARRRITGVGATLCGCPLLGGHAGPPLPIRPARRHPLAPRPNRLAGPSRSWPRSPATPPSG